jgi:hypothetical protein
MGLVIPGEVTISPVELAIPDEVNIPPEDYSILIPELANPGGIAIPVVDRDSLTRFGRTFLISLQRY